MRAAVCLLVVAACGGSDTAPVESPMPATTALPTGADDVIVAQVNGRPVWGSCVAAQMKRKPGAAGATIDKQAALQECIDFELLAARADANGLAADPDVRDATRTALVSRFVEREYEQKYARPEDMKDFLDAMVERNKIALDIPERRAAQYIRVELCGGTTCVACEQKTVFPIDQSCGGHEKPADPAYERRAKAYVDEVYAELKNETGLFPLHLIETANRLAAAHKLRIYAAYYPEDTPGRPIEGFYKDFGTALFAIPEVGRLAPPTRTATGWDVILLANLLPTEKKTREQLAAEGFPEVRRQYFNVWSAQIVRASGVKITFDQKGIAQLDTGEEDPTAPKKQPRRR